MGTGVRVRDESKPSSPKLMQRQERPWSLEFRGLVSEEELRRRTYGRLPLAVGLPLAATIFSGLFLLSNLIDVQSAQRFRAVELDNYVMEVRWVKGGRMVVFDNHRKVTFPRRSLPLGVMTIEPDLEPYDHLRKKMGSYDIAVNGRKVIDGAWVHEQRRSLEWARRLFVAAIASLIIAAMGRTHACWLRSFESRE
jgi:hypothetical protein